MSYRNDDSNGNDVWGSSFSAQKIAIVGFCLLVTIVTWIVVKVTLTEDDRLNTAIDISKLELKHSPYNYSFESSEKVITVSLWQSGLTSESKKAYDGDKDAVMEWQKTKDNILQYANSIDVNMGLQDIKDITIIVQLVNEDNHARKLLVYKDCMLVYDVTKGE